MTDADKFRQIYEVAKKLNPNAQLIPIYEANKGTGFTFVHNKGHHLAKFEDGSEVLLYSGHLMPEEVPEIEPPVGEPKYMAKLPHTVEGYKILKGLQEYLNKSVYTIVVRGSCPLPPYKVTTASVPLGHAQHLRIYINAK